VCTAALLRALRLAGFAAQAIKPVQTGIDAAMIYTAALYAYFVKRGVWVRPFNNLYLMPPYSTTAEDVALLCAAVEGSVLSKQARHMVRQRCVSASASSSTLLISSRRIESK